MDGRQYAVKRSAHRFRGKSERNRSVREARNHERLPSHPHILHFVAAWEECGRLYIQTELCSTSLLLHAENQPPGQGMPIFLFFRFCIRCISLHVMYVLLANLAFIWHVSIQVSLQHGPTCVTSSQRCNTCTLMVLCIWTSSPPMSSWLTLGVSNWETSGCFLNSNRRVQYLQRGEWKRISRREIPGTWPLSCSVGSMDQLQMFSGTNNHQWGYWMI